MSTEQQLSVVWGDLSSRERDWLIHTAIFDAEGCPHHSVKRLGGTLTECRACGEQFGDTTYAMARSWPAYSTDIRAAWEVVKTVQERDLCPLINGYADGPWTVEFWPEVGIDAHGVADAPEAPEAICIAALRACGVEVLP